MLRRLLSMASELPAKRLKPSPPLIGTHNGHFHADEALAVYLLRLLPAYQGSPLLRTRDPEGLAACHTVVDVGGVYDDAAHRYDHHQRGFAERFPGRTATPLSSAGLVWLHFGRAVIAHRTGFAADSHTTDLLWDKLYTDFVEAVDANDNGVAAYDAEAAGPAKFKSHGVTLASLVSDLNHEFDLEGLPGPVPIHETASNLDRSPATSLEAVKAPGGSSAPSATGDTTYLQAAEDDRFQRASALMGIAFMRKLHGLHTVWLPARTTVGTAFAARRLLDSYGRLLELSGGGVPWKEHLYAFEQDEYAAAGPEGGQVLYVIYPENAADQDSRWRVQAVSVSAESFQSRLPLPEQWRGVRDAELSALSGIEGCIFVHASGFIGGNATREGALAMARKSMEMGT